MRRSSAGGGTGGGAGAGGGRPFGRFAAAAAVGAALSASLVAGGLSPAWAESGEPAGAPSVALGSFAVGDGVDAMIGERDGSVAFQVSVGGIYLSWDSRSAGVDRHGLGERWGLGLARVDRDGGLRVFPSSGGSFEAATESPSGLLGYPGRDVVFKVAAEGAMLPARPDGAVDARPVAYELHELGGVVTSFDEAGEPIGRVGPDGSRTDWIWGDQSRLESVVDADGVETALSWSGTTLTIRRGVNLTGASVGSGAGGVWRVELQDDRVARVLDPVGALTEFRYDRAGLLSGIEASSGSETVLEWRPGLDAVERVAAVRVLDTAGHELSARTWSPTAGTGSVSAWPRSAGALDRAGFGTTLSDGLTRIESEFDGWGLLTGRRVVTTTDAGAQILQEQEFSFPDRGGATDPALVPAKWSRPESVSVTYRDASGASRTGTESLEFDDAGRMVRRVAADGTITQRTYDEVVAEDAVLPVGLPTSETVTGADGLVATTEYGLSEDRKTPVSVRTTSVRPGEEAAVTGFTAFTVEAGRVVERRVFPGGDERTPPVVTTWQESTDLVKGEKTVSETAAAGTPLAATTASVVSLVHGGTLSSTDVLGSTSTSTFDVAGRPIAATDSTGLTVSSSYRPADADGVSTATVTGPDGVSVTEERDELGRLLRVYDDIAPTGQPVKGHVRVSETRAYPAPGVVEVTDAWGASTRTETDLFGRPVKTVLPNGLVQVTVHDDVAGSATVWTSPTGDEADAEQTTTRVFDDAGRTVQVTGTRADGVAVPEVSSVYDGLGRQVATVDGVTESTVGYDAAGNPIRSTTAPSDGPAPGAQPASRVAQRRFDAFGVSLEKTVSGDGEERSGGTRELDVLGRTVVETDQAGVATRLEYSPDGLVQRSVSDTGRTVEHTYDDRTRALLRSETRSPVGESVVTEYDVEEGSGRLLAVWDPADAGTTRIDYEYDAFGNPTLVQYPAEVPGGPRKRVRHVYDEHGRKTATIDVAGTRTDYAYDPAGFLTGAVQRDATGTVELARVGYGYDRFGRVDRVERGNGVVTVMSYTSTNQVASETTTSGDAILSARTYEYDPATGNLTVRVDRTRPAGEAELVAARTEYRYDTLGRLVGSATRDGETVDGPVRSETAYEVNGSGQVTAETVTSRPGTPEAASTTRRFDHAPVGELVSVTTERPDGRVETATQEWDTEGNLVRGVDGTTFGWDAANRRTLETRPDGTTVRTAYWADGTRKELATDRGLTRFHWAGDTLLNDTHTVAGTGEAGTASYLLAATRHARTTQPAGGAASTAYYGADRHGNVTDLTDAAGQVATAYTYSDYGVPTGTQLPSALPAGVGDLDRNPFGYSSEYGHEDGTQFLRERILDPGMLGFQSEDREGLHNVFGYANANPIMMVDPSGRDAIIDWVSIGFAAYGAVSALSGVLAIVTGGASLGAFGIAAAAFGVADGVFTALEAAAVLTNQKFMPEEAALGIGIGMAVVGTTAMVGGIVKGLRSYAAKRAGAAGRVAGAPESRSLLPDPDPDADGSVLGHAHLGGEVDEHAPLLPKQDADPVVASKPDPGPEQELGLSGLPIPPPIDILSKGGAATSVTPTTIVRSRLIEIRRSLAPLQAAATGITKHHYLHFEGSLRLVDQNVEYMQRSVDSLEGVIGYVAKTADVNDVAMIADALHHIGYEAGNVRQSLASLIRYTSDVGVHEFARSIDDEITGMLRGLDVLRF